MLIFNGFKPGLKDRLVMSLVLITKYLIVGAFNIIVASLVLGMKASNFSSPWISGGDGQLNLILARNIQRSGWILYNEHLGAPGKSNIFDLPQGGENLQFLAIKIIAYFSSATAAVNIYFLFTFAAVAMGSFGAAKWWGLKDSTAVVVSCLYSFLPYHFFHGEGHLLLCMYAFLPVVIVYCFKSVKSEVALSKPKWALFVIFAGSINSYYTVFALLLILITFVYNLLRARINLKQQIALLVSIGIVFVLNQLTSIIYMIIYGSNPVVNDRGYDGAEVYGLQITDMFLPRIGHRIGLFSRAGQAVSDAGLRSELGQSLGFVAAVGVASLILYGIFKVIRQESMSERFHFPFIMILGIILLTVSSSVTLLLGLGGFTQIRSWNRVVVIIAFIGLLIFGYFIEQISERYNIKKTFGYLILVCILAFGIFDQTSVDDKITLASMSSTLKSECELLEKIQSNFDGDAKVFQLPFVEFPEDGAVENLAPYEQGLATLCDTDLRFSFGAVRGRNDSFARNLSNAFDCSSNRKCNDNDIEKGIAKLKKDNFSVLLIYTNGYSDNGKSLTNQLEKIIGKPIGNSSQTLVAFLL